MSNIEVTLHVTSYNRPFRLKNCIDSFFKSSTYDMSKLEMIIVDNGSTDERVLNYIKELTPPCQKYSYVLNPENDYPGCLRYSKIQARKIANGKYFIDCPDDHLFVVKSDWIETCISHLLEDETAGCTVHFAQPAYRFLKQNNKMSKNEKNELFFRTHLKGYADYHVMRRDVYEELGPYDYALGRKAEDEYMVRALENGYFRNIIKFPVAIVNDDLYESTGIIDQKIYEDKFRDIEIPVSNEQLTELGLELGALGRATK